MRRNRIIAALGFLLICTTAEAAIPLNSLQTFDLAPGATNWATGSAGGGGASILSPGDLDLAVQTNEVSAITNVLRATSAGATFGLAQWNSTARCVQTRPAGVAYQVLLTTIENTSGVTLPSVAIAYDFGNPAPFPVAEDPGLNGLRAFYSLTGQAGSWTLIPEFSTGEPGGLAAEVMLGSWPPTGLLYLLWADDNGDSATDSAFTIDNLWVSIYFPPPLIISQPQSTNVVVGQTIRLSITATGIGLNYLWFKDGLPLDPLLNPTATQPTLIITNAQIADSGTYRCAVSDFSSGAISDSATVNVVRDTTPPRFVFAYDIPDNPTGFRLIVSVSELLCTDASVCGSDATSPFNWVIYSTAGSELFVPETITINGTNVEFTFQSSRITGQSYVISPDPLGDGISDLFGNLMPAFASISSYPARLFKQGFDGYGGTQDTEIHSDALADNVLGAAQAINVDLDTAGTAQGLLRFNNLFGNGAGQLYQGTWILRATLSLVQIDSGSAVTLHRMLIPWDQTSATWNGFVGGIAANDFEARSRVDALVSRDATGTIDVTAGVQAWSDGEANYGWLLQSTGTDGFTFASSESAQPPSLTIVFQQPDPPCVISITQHPASLTLAEGQSFTLTVSLSPQGFCPLAFQWMKNGVNIQAAHSISFSIPAASVCDAGSYQVIVSAAGGQSVTSNPAIVTIPADIVRPVVTRAFGGLDGTNITLTFSKVMNSSNAPDTAHYVLDPLVAVTGALLSPDGQSVTLTTAPRSPLTPYTLRIQDVTDNRAACLGSIGNVISPNPTLVRLTGVRVDVPWDSEWLYSTNNQDATLSTPAPWYTPNFSHGADWIAGQALFGTELSPGVVAQFPAPLLTPIPPNTNTPPNQITTYFRKLIELPALPPGATYTLCHFIDDGAVFYLDGGEIGRVSMIGSSPFLFAHRASTAFEASVQCFPFAAAPGPHTLAVEVHQGGQTTSSDILFGAQVEAITSAPVLDVGNRQPIVSWNADSYWELVTSTNAAGPYATVLTNPSFPLGTHYGLPTNPAAFYRLRFNGVAK